MAVGSSREGRAPIGQTIDASATWLQWRETERRMERDRETDRERQRDGRRDSERGRLEGPRESIEDTPIYGADRLIGLRRQNDDYDATSDTLFIYSTFVTGDLGPCRTRRSRTMRTRVIGSFSLITSSLHRSHQAPLFLLRPPLIHPPTPTQHSPHSFDHSTSYLRLTL